MRVCEVEGCDKNYACGGFCHMHYLRWRKYGSPLVVKRIMGELPVSKVCFCGKQFSLAASVVRKKEKLGQKVFFCSRECKVEGTRTDEVERFWAFVRKTSECWEWTGGKDPDGYGIFSSYNRGRCRPIRAHRYAYRLQVGKIPEGKDVLHTCDNPPCVKGEHLWIGTNQDNSNDMVAKGRHGRSPASPGIRNIRAKLTEAQVREIRRTNPSKVVAAKKYNVSTMTIWHVVNRKTWRHLK